MRTRRPTRQERMRLRSQTLRKPRPHDFHFCFRQSRRQSAKADQVRTTARNSAAPAAGLCSANRTKTYPGNSGISNCTRRSFQRPHGTVKRKKVLHPSHPELGRDALFMIRTCVCGIPARLDVCVRVQVQRADTSASITWRVLRDSILKAFSIVSHSFAPSLTGQYVT